MKTNSQQSLTADGVAWIELMVSPKVWPVDEVEGRNGPRAIKRIVTSRTQEHLSYPAWRECTSARSEAHIALRRSAMPQSTQLTRAVYNRESPLKIDVLAQEVKLVDEMVCGCLLGRPFVRGRVQGGSPAA